MRLHRLMNSFYSRYIVAGIALLCITSLAFSAVICSVFQRLEAEKYIKTYDLALESLNRSFQEKYETFSDMLSPLFSDRYADSFYRELCDFLESGEYRMTYHVSTALMDIFSDICSDGSGCVGLLLYSGNTGSLYQYSPQLHALTQIPVENGALLQPRDFSNKVFCYQELCSLTSSFTAQSPIFGIKGNIFYYADGRLEVPGNIVLLYSADSLSSFSSSYSLDPGALFSITSPDGLVLYSSSGEYFSPPPLSAYDLPEATLQNVWFRAAKSVTGGRAYYCSAIYSGRFEYLVQYTLPADLIPESLQQHLFFILALIICLISVCLYLVTFLSSARKVRCIRYGMDQIGENNLSYRLALPKTEDEFFQIMSGFNRMCEELQRNVEQSYIHRLRQKESELYALQTSINPHFLYNTLEMIRITFMQDRKADANQMILLLSRIYRNQLGKDTYITIYDELNQCEYLILLYQYRFENFDYDLEIAPEFHGYALPKNALQPLIENFFVHGIDSERDDNYLEVSAEWTERGGKRVICLTVFNTGHAPDAEALAAVRKRLEESALDNHSAKGFALSNVNDSLRLSFGAAYGLELEAASGGDGLYVRLVFPPRRPGDLSSSRA